MCANFQSKWTTFNFFGINLGKLPNYVQYFGSNIVEGVAESWVETGMSWGEVDGAGGTGWSWLELGARFSNTHTETDLLEPLEPQHFPHSQPLRCQS